MYDLISIGNISIDLYFKGKSLTFANNRFQLAVGGKYFADHFYTSVGGGGANVAIGASYHKLKTAVLGKIGNNPFKKIIVEELHFHKVETRLCYFLDNYINTSCILLTTQGERTIVHYSTPHQHLLPPRLSMNRIFDAKFVYFGNIVDVSLKEREDVLAYLVKKKITTVMNLGVKDCRRPKSQIENLLKKTDILILNGHEFADLVKAPYKDIHFNQDIVSWYIPFLKEKIVVITQGKQGSFAYIFGKVYHQPALKVDQILDTTGAGDAFSAGFISEYFRSKNLELAMLKASQYAAKILAKIGAN